MRQKRFLLAVLGVGFILLNGSDSRPVLAATPPSDKPSAPPVKSESGMGSAEGKINDGAFEEAMQSYLSKDENLEKMGKAFESFSMRQRQKQMEDAKKRDTQRREEQFNKPVKIDIGSSPVKGNPEAKVTVIEFSDFQCPYCRRGSEVVQEVLKAYPNDVKIVFKNFPLSFHHEAMPAAVVALAAKEQGKFWEMYRELFNNQEKLGDATYKSLAEKLGLDMAKFEADRKDGKLQKLVEEDMKLGQQSGVQGTPGFFINGVQLEGAQPLPVFKEVIDRWLAKPK